MILTNSRGSVYGVVVLAFLGHPPAEVDSQVSLLVILEVIVQFDGGVLDCMLNKGEH
jgi:hypothetical protein